MVSLGCCKCLVGARLESSDLNRSCGIGKTFHVDGGVAFESHLSTRKGSAGIGVTFNDDRCAFCGNKRMTEKELGNHKQRHGAGTPRPKPPFRMSANLPARTH